MTPLLFAIGVFVLNGILAEVFMALSRSYPGIRWLDRTGFIFPLVSPVMVLIVLLLLISGKKANEGCSCDRCVSSRRNNSNGENTSNSRVDKVSQEINSGVAHQVRALY